MTNGMAFPSLHTGPTSVDTQWPAPLMQQNMELGQRLAQMQFETARLAQQNYDLECRVAHLESAEAAKKLEISNTECLQQRVAQLEDTVRTLLNRIEDKVQCSRCS